jgi:hypothetical protein
MKTKQTKDKTRVTKGIKTQDPKRARAFRRLKKTPKILRLACGPQTFVALYRPDGEWDPTLQLDKLSRLKFESQKDKKRSAPQEFEPTYD